VRGAAEESSAADGPDPSPPVDLSERSGLPLEAYGDSLDYDVSYDDAVAAKYDDGYDPDAYAQFDAALAPYGTWIDDPSYGRIWVPAAAQVGDDFTPYATNGDWLDTEYGWTWSSGWAWGWAPFHYGRWVCLDRGQGAGWGWVPGTLWGPAWVSWRSGGGYVGWAPLPPRGVSMGSPIGVHSPWRFTPVAKLGRTHGSYLSPRFVPSVFLGTTVVSNARLLPDGGSAVRVNAGPPAGIRGGVASAPLVRLATAAPRALPRLAIRPHAGTSVSGRPWVRAGVTTQFFSERWQWHARDLSVAEAPRVAFGSGLRLGGSAGQGQRYQPSIGRAVARSVPSSGGTFIVPFRSPSSFRFRGSAGATAQPGFTASSPSFTAAPPSFTAPTANFSSAAPFYARPSAPAFHGGGGTHSSGGRHR
jgi:hypothetical protein